MCSSDLITEGRMMREDGVITGVEIGPLEVLRARHRAPLSRKERDSEGLAVAPDGTIFISFEAVHGLRRSEERRVGKECRSRWSPYH